MTRPAETYTAANRELDDMANALVQGASMAPPLTMDTIFALRSVLERHRPRRRYRPATACAHCRVDWPCADAADVLKAMGLHEDDDEDEDY